MNDSKINKGWRLKDIVNQIVNENPPRIIAYLGNGKISIVSEIPIEAMIIAMDGGIETIVPLSKDEFETEWQKRLKEYGRESINNQ